MTASEIFAITLRHLPFEPNEEQLTSVQALSAFLSARGPADAFILNGYAGTGKTSVVGALVKAMDELKIRNVILAPTGRAAKVAANLSSGRASTIHKRLFRGNSADPSNSSFFLAENKNSDTIFIIDEASLVTDGSSFSSSLLMQLVNHVYNGKNCNMILVGDVAQLPPVGQSESFAMNPDRLRELGLSPVKFTLSKPARQAEESGILFNATIVRQFLQKGMGIGGFSIYEKGFSDVRLVDASDFLDELSSSWNKVGKDETIVVTRSNFRANNINATIRKYLLDAEAPLQAGEKLIISKNDYYWSKENKLNNFLANGESAEILKVGKKEKAYGRWFADTDLKISGIENPVHAKVIFRSLVSEGPSLPKEEMQRFYNRVLDRYEGELSEKIKKSMEDPYYNALQVKYGYCVTCHKAQGGQWKHVYVDLGGMGGDFSESDFFRWLYTAVTRATEKVFFINSPFPSE